MQRKPHLVNDAKSAKKTSDKLYLLKMMNSFTFPKNANALPPFGGCIPLPYSKWQLLMYPESPFCRRHWVVRAEQSRPVMVSVPTILKSNHNCNQSTLLRFLIMGSESERESPKTLSNWLEPCLLWGRSPREKARLTHGQKQCGEMERVPCWHHWLHLSWGPHHIFPFLLLFIWSIKFPLGLIS